MQILLAAVGAVNGIVSSFFASNFVGTDAMSAVGLYSPLNMLVSSVSAILVGGSVILCGKYMGQNRQDIYSGKRRHQIMSEERKLRLESIGMIWNARNHVVK
ncbi:MAG: hypothetical protein K6G56_04065 [Clostridiales bacterium]|nr:hypothetical protein [Clostridiales bacterium]